MMQPGPGGADQQVEQIIGNLLRWGVITAAAVVFLGAIVYLAGHGLENTADHYHIFKGEPGDLRSPAGVVSDAWTLRGRGLIQLGLLLLIATPIARVIFSVYAFARQRDYLYVLFTLIVLAVLLFSLFYGS
jgi:uncharacterized membrane protein